MAYPHYHPLRRVKALLDCAKEIKRIGGPREAEVCKRGSHRPQRDTSSTGYRLLVSRAFAGASREPSPRRSPALAPLTCAVSPTFRYGAFLFVASALAAVPSARLWGCRASPNWENTTLAPAYAARPKASVDMAGAISADRRHRDKCVAGQLINRSIPCADRRQL